MATLGRAVLETGVDDSGLRAGLTRAEGTSQSVFTRIGGAAKGVMAAGISVATTATQTFRQGLTQMQGTASGVFGQIAGTAKSVLAAGISGVTTAAKEMGAGLGDIFSKVGQNAGKVLGGAVRSGILALGAAILTLGMLSVETASKFEVSMAVMSTAVDPLTVGVETAAEAMGILGDASLAVGADTQLVGVSASSAAESITALYKAGLTTGEVFGDLQGYLDGTAELGGALRASIDLAAASELDMVSASELAAITLATFGGELQNTEARAAFVNSAMNTLVQTADASVASVSGLSAALVNVGPTAAALGISFEDVNTALGILSTRGIQGSEAGTALKSMLVGMMSDAPKTTAALEDLGVSLYDIDGVMRPLPDILADFESALAGVTEEERNLFTQQIAGAYGMNAFNALIAEGADGWASLETAISGASTMQEVAAARTDTFAGKMEALQGVAETLLIQIGTPFLDALGKLGDLMVIIADEAAPGLIARFELWADTLGKAVDLIILAVTWGDQLNMAFEEQSNRLLLANTDYATYTAGVLAAGVASGQLTERQAELLTIFLEGGAAMEEMEQATSGRFTPTMLALMETIGLVTEEERVNAQQVDSLERAYAAAGVTTYVWKDAVVAGTDALIASDEPVANATTGAWTLTGAVQGVAGAYDSVKTASSLANDAIGQLTETSLEQARMQAVVKLATEDLTAAEQEAVMNQLDQLAVLQQLNTDIASGKAGNEEFYAVMLGGVDTMEEYNAMFGETSSTISSTETALINTTGAAADVNATLADSSSVMSTYRADLDTIEEGLGNVEDASGGLQNTASGIDAIGNAAAGAVAGVNALADAVQQLGNKTPGEYIPSSPPPFAQGLYWVADAAASLQVQIGTLAGSTERLSTAFADGLLGSIEAGLEEGEGQLERLDGILDAAGKARRIGGSFADIFEGRTLDPLRTTFAGLDEEIAGLLAGPIDEGTANRLNELTMQRVELARELAEQEERILELQQKQQELDFLQAQLDLLKLADEAGLDTSIFQGMLGLGADPAALTDLMDEVIQALIDQANESLETGSPSKVFTRIGETIPAGLVRAMDAGVGGVTEATRQLTRAAIDVADGTLAQGQMPVGGVKAGAQGGERGVIHNEFVFDFREARGVDEQKVERAVERAMAKVGVRADVMRRTR